MFSKLGALDGGDDEFDGNDNGTGPMSAEAAMRVTAEHTDEALVDTCPPGCGACLLFGGAAPRPLHEASSGPHQEPHGLGKHVAASPGSGTLGQGQLLLPVLEPLRHPALGAARRRAPPPLKLAVPGNPWAPCPSAMILVTPSPSLCAVSEY